MFFSKRHMLVPALGLMSTGAFAAAVDISAEVATWSTDAGTYFGYILPGVFVMMGFYLAIKLIKKMVRS